MAHPPLFFVHIPKTAGLSLHWAMVNAFPFSLSKRVNSERELLQMPASNIDRCMFLSAHARYGFHKALSSDPFIFTFLRSPINRTISSYWHLKYENPEKFEDPNFKEVVKECQSHSLEEIVFNHDSVAIGQLTNVQTWYLSGPEIERRQAKADVVADDIALAELYRVVPSVDASNVGEQELAAAKSTLASLSAFGIVESMWESLGVLEKRLGLNRSAMPTINVRKSPSRGPTITDRVKTRINELTYVDNELYTFASNLFHQRIEEIPCSSRAFRPLAAENMPGAPFREVKRQVNEGFIGGGWYPREEKSGDIYCWNGFMPESWIDVFMDVNSDLEIVLKIVACMNWDIPRNIRISCNGVRAPTQFRRHIRGGDLKARIPKRVVGDGPRLIRIVIPVSEAISPVDIRKGSNDTRKLSMALSAFEVRQRTN